jgi:hypothetical protein
MRRLVVIAFSTFDMTPPANSPFGRTLDPKQQVLCTNPANLGGRSGALTPYFVLRKVGHDTLGPTWGLHLYDGNIALGNLVDIVQSEANAYTASH